MEAPKCRLCGLRHWPSGGCADRAPSPAFEKIAAGLEDALAFAKGDESKAIVTVINVPLIAPPGQCPHCDARRAYNAQRVALHRERKRNITEA